MNQGSFERRRKDRFQVPWQLGVWNRPMADAARASATFKVALKDLQIV
jgi:hypothetical protein